MDDIKKRLAELKSAADTATPGPWFRQYGDVITSGPDPRDIHSDAPRPAQVFSRAGHLDHRDRQGIRNANFAVLARSSTAGLVEALEGVIGLCEAAGPGSAVASDLVLEAVSVALTDGADRRF